METDIAQVKRKTDEEFHFWLEAKFAAQRREVAQAKKPKKRGH